MPRNIKRKSQPATATTQALLCILTYFCDLRQSQHILIKSVKTHSQGKEKKKCQILSPGKLKLISTVFAQI